MPDGITHHFFWKLGWGCTIPASFAIMPLLGLPGGIGAILGYSLGAFIDPDLDQIGTTAAEGRIVNALPIVGSFIYGYTSIYGSLFRKHHRSFWTHFPVVSTAIRCMWFFWWIYFVVPESYDWMFQLGWGAFIGLCIADTIHWVLDMFFPDTGKSNLPLTKYSKKSDRIRK